MDIFEQLDGKYIHEATLIDRGALERGALRRAGLIVALDDRPTLRMRPQDHKTAMRHIHEGAWTVGMYEEDLPGFES